MSMLGYTEYIFEASRLSGSLVMKERRKMREMLRNNILTFKFQKKDGSIRKAHGTLHPDFLPKIKGTGGPRPEYQMVYYDLDKFGWRSFRSFKFIKVLKSEPVDDSKIEEFMKEKEREEKRRRLEKRRGLKHREVPERIPEKETEEKTEKE